MTLKVLVELECEEDGYPPVSVESLNAEELEPGFFRIKNSPFFRENIAYGDIVAASPIDRIGYYQFDCVVIPSGFTSVSIILIDEMASDILMKLFCGSLFVVEYGEFGSLKMLAVSIPPSIEYGEIKSNLMELEEKEMISFSELAVALGKTGRR